RVNCLYCSHRPRPPTSALFPYTTLFRSDDGPPRHNDTGQTCFKRQVQLTRIWAPGGGCSRAGEGKCAGRERASFDKLRMREVMLDRKSTRLNSSHVKISYAVFCLKKKK